MLDKVRRLPLAVRVAALAMPLIPVISLILFRATRRRVTLPGIKNLVPTQFDLSLHKVFLPSLLPAVLLSGVLLLAELHFESRGTARWKRNLSRLAVGAVAAAIIVIGCVLYHRIDAFYN